MLGTTAADFQDVSVRVDGVILLQSVSTGNTNVDACKARCISFSSSICRAINFNPSSRRCILFADSPFDAGIRFTRETDVAITHSVRTCVATP